MVSVIHLLNGLDYGGKEQVALRLARRGIADGLAQRLVLYDSGYRDPSLDFDPRGVPCDVLRRRPRLDPLFALRLARLIAARRAQVVHAHTATALTYAAAARLVTRFHLIATLHIDLAGHSRRSLRALRLASGAADRVVCVSRDLARRVEGRTGIRRLDVIPNGVDLAAFVPDFAGVERRALLAALGLSADVLLVGALGRLEEVKRHADLIEAAGLARAAGIDIHVVIGGTGTLAAHLAARAAQIGSVSLTGAVADPARFLRALDVLVHPSADEAAPLVLLEGLACGLPVIATDVGGVREIVGDGRDAAVLVPAHRPDAIARALIGLAGDAPRRTRMRIAARARSAQFDAADEWRRYRALYEASAVRSNT